MPVSLPQPNTVHPCLYCGEDNSRVIRRPYGGSYRQCYNCGTSWTPCGSEYHDQETGEIITRHNICRRCLNENYYRRCGDCNRYARNLESVFRDDRSVRQVCSECLPNYQECEHCSRGVHTSQVTIDINGNNFCPDCRSEFLVRCSSCNEYRRRHSIEPCSCGSNAPACSCRACVRERQREQERNSVTYMNEWNYRPTPKFHGEGPLFLGMELEVETGDYTQECKQVVDKYTTTDLCYLKWDGSIQSGFELVTHPMDYSWARENFPWEMLPALSDAGATTHARVGIHVHLSRAGFSSSTHIFKWMKFIYRNSDQVTKIAGREAYDWAAFNPDDRENIKHYCKGKHNTAGGRYRAINTCNSSTFELRVFKSTLDPHKVKAYLGLADASVKYTRELSTSAILDGGWNWAAFYAWLADKPEYADLRERMEELSCVS